ncbi:SDR family oxidoreductase [Labrys okinawensis]|uniref:SDR family oxidoreductase n=1 Tax=Labrys okinawensis TaxID=346911 RepID=UPI0039BCC075
MKIVVVGGTGLIGAKLVTLLRLDNHNVVSASPSTGVSTITSEGLAQALSGAEIVVDVSNSPSLKKNAALAFFEISGRNLLAAEAAAGVRHHVVLSVVGTNRLPENGYFRAKMAQENLVRASNAPFTILRSAPFFEYINGIVEAHADGDTLRVSPAYVQPIAADDVALALRDVVLGRAQNGEIEVVGPDRFRLSDLAREILAANEDPRPVIADAEALYFGAVLQENTLKPDDRARIAPTRFEDWLRRAIAETLTPAF